MRPFAVLNAILFGSATAIAFGLVGVVIIFLFLQGRHPEVAQEFGTLLRSAVLFTAVAAVCGWSLYATLKQTKTRRLAQGAMWLGLSLLLVLYWPR